jgi:hypothetical protein
MEAGARRQQLCLARKGTRLLIGSIKEKKEKSDALRCLLASICSNLRIPGTKEEEDLGKEIARNTVGCWRRKRGKKKGNFWGEDLDLDLEDRV